MYYSAGSLWSAFSGPNLGYVLEQYDLFLQSPEEVEPELVALFETYGAPQLEGVEVALATTGAAQGDYKKVLAAVKLAEAIRSHGHLAADLISIKRSSIRYFSYR